ncbi:urease accessory protein UreE [Roseococcus sp.]|uniref:urease accessory protein UreE C-terminal domain-containing protein n=1 Tax=Roseococcus sp. TaxID=2109646 RepID=UPI003BACA1AA
MHDTLPRATKVLPAGSFTADAEVRLDFDDRFRRRKRYETAGGIPFVLDLAEAQVLRDGDGLLLDDGRAVLVRAAEETLVEVRATSPSHLVRLAWHIGNRHLPAELQADRILIREDHVIEAMLRGLGATVTKVRAPFNPEGGAYGEHNRSSHQPFREHGQDHHSHDHGHDHDHDHRHDHDHGHGHHHHHRHGD